MRCCVAEDYVAMCTACKKAVDRKDLQYVNGLSYHTACSAQSGSNSGIINSDETRLKVDIVTLKNLRSLLSPRSSAGTGKKKTVVKRKASSKRKTTKRKTAPKRKTSVKKTKRKTAPKRKTVKRKAAPKRKAQTRKIKRKPTTRKKIASRKAPSHALWLHRGVLASYELQSCIQHPLPLEMILQSHQNHVPDLISSKHLVADSARRSLYELPHT